MTITHISERELALQRENERLTDQVKLQSATIHVQAVAIQAMQDDAERYRWLRDNDMFANPSVDMARIFSRYADSFLDGHIDAAMKETKS